MIDIILQFPLPEDSKLFDKLRKFCGNVENIETAFGVEFSCGDGKYLSDLWQWEGEGLRAVASNEELEKYDGKVCLTSVPRFLETKELLKAGKKYRFTVKHNLKTEKYIYYLNSKLTSRSFYPV